jgi:hypothetical protein
MMDVKEDGGGFWSGVLDGVQTGLDFVGLIPGVGEIADGANALIYTARGDYVNAGLSAAAMVPIGGWAATGTKLVRKSLSNADLVQKSATKAEAAIGGTGRFAGTAKHTYATELLKRYQRRYGDRGLRFGVSFNNGPGNIGRVDVLDRTNSIIYDWKFGYPGMTPAQLNNTPQMLKYQRNFGLPTQIIKP